MDIEMKHIVKAFGSNQVLNDVSILVKHGTIHALMGENGAGKSTLMNILTGLYLKDGGTIKIDGVEKYFANPREAEMAGISFIHQEMNTFTEMTVLENLFLGKEIKNKFGFLSQKEMTRKAVTVFEKLGIEIDLNQVIGTLSVGEQQMIEIAKSMLYDLSFLIMDEPTAALTEKEIEILFEVIKKLKAEGIAIVYISHRMEEIFRITDEITVMRDGLSIDTTQTSETTKDELVKKMVGRDITDYYPDKTAIISDDIFQVKNLTGEGFKNINFSVRRGEIVGFSGLMGAGRTEMMRGIFGLDKIISGEISIDGIILKELTPVNAIANGLGFLTENRKEEGLVLDFSIGENIVLPSLKSFVKKGFVDTKTEDEFVNMMVDRLKIKVQSSRDIVGNLSGGNQQKAVIAKWIGISPKVLILDEPTRGVDVGAKREIYGLMNELAERGVGIIMVSSDLPEILGVSDRVIVIREGEISGEVTREEATQENIMTLATGGKING
ncbi:ribose import ATP-binding protein RbsA [Bacilli bacterium]|nr:ribose import ATP-binding protein RbsA [Bacilli bacterium]GHU44118.1 ribose import ATP-binding protein RbsA [Bacilli bacterium]